MSHGPCLSAAFAAMLALGACSKPAPQSDLDKADERTKLGDEILVDPALAHGEKHADSEAMRPRHGQAHGPAGDDGPREAAPAAPSPPPPASAPAPAPAKAIKALTPPAPHALVKAPQPSPARPPIAPKPTAAAVQTAMATTFSAPAKPAPATTEVAKPKAPAQLAAAKPKPVSPKTKQSVGNCLAKLQPGTSWATKLPVGFPLYPKSKVIDAAGIDSAGCAARAISFTVSAPAATLIDWYRDRVTKAGFDASVERSGKDEVLAGTGPSDSAYIITFGKRLGGVTNVDMIVNGAR